MEKGCLVSSYAGSCGCEAYGWIIEPNLDANSYLNCHANAHIDTKPILTC